MSALGRVARHPARAPGSLSRCKVLATARSCRATCSRYPSCGGEPLASTPNSGFDAPELPRVASRSPAIGSESSSEGAGDEFHNGAPDHRPPRPSIRPPNALYAPGSGFTGHRIGAAQSPLAGRRQPLPVRFHHGHPTIPRGNPSRRSCSWCSPSHAMRNEVNALFCMSLTSP